MCTELIVSVCLSRCRAAIKDVYLLEFHPSLAIASQISPALSHAYWVGSVTLFSNSLQQVCIILFV